MIRRVLARWLIIMTALLPLMTGLVWAEEAPEVSRHNTILVIDNSRSTTGRHSLGGATDPSGLRFDAAQLVYQNVVSSAATGSRGELGVIVFCGSDNCVSYGPMEIDDPALDDAIGSHLNAATNADRRDNYTDIRTALATALDMLRDFEGSTSVILLTDGVNDLTNRPNPFSRPENIAANEESAEIVSQLCQAGADFHVIALTAQDGATNSDQFMVFINRLAEAGGGTPNDEGDYDNVLMATQSDLNSKLLQMLIRSEHASDVQTIVEYTPVYAPFTVPYDGITDATVNITFMPEDKALLEQVALVGPEGESRVLWTSTGAVESEDITVTESRSYIMLKVPSPTAGAWNVEVTSQKTEGGTDASVLINAVVRFNHSLRLQVAAEEQAALGTRTHVSAWFQRFNGETFEDLTDSDIYAQSTALLTLYTPNGRQRTATMPRQGDRFVVGFTPKTAGTWRAQVTVKNDYVQQTADEIEFQVVAPPTAVPTPVATPEPTAEPTPIAMPGTTAQSTRIATPEATAQSTPMPTAVPTATWKPRQTPVPTPTPSPEPQVVPIERLDLSIEPCATTEAGELLLTAGQVRFDWTLEGETDSVEAVLLQDDRVIGKLNPGMGFDSSFFREGPEYALQVTAMPKNGVVMGAEPTVETLRFRAAPSPIAPEAIRLSVEPVAPDSDEALYVDRNAEAIALSWEIDRETERVEATLLEDGEPLAEHLQSGDTVPREQLKDGAEYTLRVSALPVYGALTGTPATEQSLSFRLYPLAQAVEGLSLQVSGGKTKNGVTRITGRSADLSWHVDSGEIDHYVLSVTDAQGNAVLRETLGPDSTGYTLNKSGKGDYSVTLTAVPRYAAEGDAVVASGTAAIHTLSFLERFWMFIAGAAALLVAGAVALFLLLKDRNAKRVTGTLRVRCDALGMNKLLTFLDDPKGVKVDDPITRHPELAKLKGSPAYKLLENLRLNNASTDRDGRAPGESTEAEGRHRGNARVLRLTWSEPGTGRSEVRYVGRFDIEPTTLTLSDGTQSYEFTFTGA